MTPKFAMNVHSLIVKWPLQNIFFIILNFLIPKMQKHLKPKTTIKRSIFLPMASKFVMKVHYTIIK